jgi:hypothetical protein
MNIEEAKLILSAYRPDGQDAGDPEFQEALELTKQDPELARWFAEAQTWDHRIAVKLRQAASPPTELRSALLAQRKIIRPFPWWRRPAWVATAVAACVSLLLLIGALFVTPSPDRPFAQYREAMADFVDARLDRLDLESQDVQTLRRWLGENQAPADFTLPAGLNGRPALGCRLVEWNGHKVALLCFELDNRRMAHLLVVDRSALRDPPGSTPQYARFGAIATAAWSQAERVYLLAGHGALQSELAELL